MYLPDGLGVYWRDHDSVQVGLHPERSAIFDGLYPREVSLFNLLRNPCTPEDVSHWASSHQVDRERAAKIWGQVEESGLAVQNTLQGSMARTEFLALARAGSAFPERASRTGIEIHGTGVIGILLALALNNYGFASIHFSDSKPVTEAQSRWLGTAAFGQPTEQVVRPLLLPQRKKPERTFVISVTSRVFPRHIARMTLANDVGYLPVVVAEADVQVGPFVTNSPCIECVELSRRDRDAKWPLLANQAERLPVVETDIASAFQASSWVVGEILHTLAYPTVFPRLHSSVLHIPPPPAWPTIEKVSPHLECGCTVL